MRIRLSSIIYILAAIFLFALPQVVKFTSFSNARSSDQANNLAGASRTAGLTKERRGPASVSDQPSTNAEIISPSGLRD